MPTFFGGILTGVVLVGFIGGIVGELFPDFELQDLEWETLLVGGIALIHFQAYRNESKIREKRKRLAGIATLGHDISLVIDYAEEAIIFSYKFHEVLELQHNIHTMDNSDIRATQLSGDPTEGMVSLRSRFESALINFKTKKPPYLDQDLISKLGRAAADANSQEILNLLNFYQVQNSRLTGLVKKFHVGQTGNVLHAISTLNGRQCIADAAQLYILAERLFEIARGNWRFRDAGISNDEIDQCLERLLGWQLPKY